MRACRCSAACAARPTRRAFEAEFGPWLLPSFRRSRRGRDGRGCRTVRAALGDRRLAGPRQQCRLCRAGAAGIPARRAVPRSARGQRHWHIRRDAGVPATAETGRERAGRTNRQHLLGQRHHRLSVPGCLCGGEFAVEAMSDTMRREFGVYGIAVSVVRARRHRDADLGQVERGHHPDAAQRSVSPRAEGVPRSRPIGETRKACRRSGSAKDSRPIIASPRPRSRATSSRERVHRTDHAHYADPASRPAHRAAARADQPALMPWRRPRLGTMFGEVQCGRRGIHEDWGSGNGRCRQGARRRVSRRRPLGDDRLAQRQQ